MDDIECQVVFRTPSGETWSKFMKVPKIFDDVTPGWMVYSVEMEQKNELIANVNLVKKREYLEKCMKPID